MPNRNPDALAALRRVNKRIATLTAEQKSLIGQLALDARHEKIVLTALDVALDADRLVEDTRVNTSRYQRSAVALNRRIEKSSAALDSLEPSEDVEAARQRLSAASEQVFIHSYGVTSGS